ncbi:hypothetical protein CPB97_002516 [Podila verticillata]|nr:hypothetical protein CPB97_002516 [Podila verticillata]
MRLPSVPLDYRRTLHLDQDEVHGQLFPGPLTHHALENLKIDGYFYGVEDQLLLPFLENCSNNLTRLECSQASPFFNKAVSQVLTNLGLFLEHLDLLEWVQVKGLSLLPPPEKIEVSDTKIAEIIRLNRRLKQINLCQAEQAAQLTTEAILDMCADHLKMLNVQGCVSISTLGLHKILCKATHLETLQAISSDGFFADPALSATDMTSDWATASMRRFECHIIVNRPNTEKIRDDESLETTTRETQRRVFRQLGAQTDLEYLILGHSQNTFWVRLFRHDCLELTLDNRLDELEGLTKLRELNVGSMAHGIGVPELNWMVQHWPRLERILGLFDGSVKPGVEEWVSAHPQLLCPRRATVESNFFL